MILNIVYKHGLEKYYFNISFFITESFFIDAYIYYTVHTFFKYTCENGKSVSDYNNKVLHRVVLS